MPPQLTPETIKEPHISYPYNQIIADVLFKTTFLENWGSGALRIVEACKKQNVPEPVWSINGGFIVVTFKRPTSDTGDTSHDTNVVSCATNGASHVLENVTVNVLDKLTERQRLILCQLIATGQTDVTVNVTVNASSLALKNKVTERTIKRDLSILKKNGSSKTRTILKFYVIFAL